MNNPPGYGGPAKSPGHAGSPKPNVLFIDSHCGYCKGAEALARLPEYRDHVEIVNVTESQATYKRMSDEHVFQTPTMKTPSGLVAGGPQIEDYLRSTYG